MSTRRMVLPVLLCGWLLAACASAPRADASATFIVVRHAEKANDGSRDPPLDAAGLQRAQQLAAHLERDDVVAAYATGYRRTQQTARPTAEAHALTTATYDAGTPAADFAARLKAAHAHGTVLVVGHSNTVPDIVAALCGCDAEPMPETEYDRLSTIQVTADGGAQLRVTRFGAAAPAP